ncbi:ribosome maturation factor RimM [Cellvibrio sp. ARAG 10.3]|uniref:ribosome maturation factor RimM n=1 Tax=Cellvibrio sp. ARAG 10.3 TaxID=3451358 RepID=UPI003F4615D9
MSAVKSLDLVNIGRITAVYGVKGWVKIHSYTEIAEDVFAYNPWWLKTAHGVKQVEVDEARPHGKGFVAHIKGIDDRDQAASLTSVDIAVKRDLLPDLDEGEYYWSQLEGLSVITIFNGEAQRLGRVAKLMETGANDVLVVAPDDQSIDQRERLIPYVPDQFVLAIDLAAGEMRVDWDPEF